MSKARDLANAADVLDDVSATELSYVNGVTSSIQTQLNNISGSKAQPDEPSSPTDGMIWVDTDGSTTDANFIPKTLTSTTGDIIYASSANTPARLGIGSTSQVLTVSGGVPTWATPASGGAVGNGASVLTSQSTTSGTYTDLATAGPSVTVTTGTKAMVIIGAYTGGNGTYDSYMSYAVSGATTVAASNNWAMSLLDANKQSQSYATIQTGLTAGSNTFTAKYRADGGASLSWANRYILVIDLGS